MQIIIERDNLFWFLLYYALSFPAVVYSGNKLGDWSSTKIIALVERRSKRK